MVVMGYVLSHAYPFSLSLSLSIKSILSRVTREARSCFCAVLWGMRDGESSLLLAIYSHQQNPDVVARDAVHRGVNK